MSERKSVLDYFPSLFDKKDKVYNEALFELKLVGSTVHTDLLFATVSFKDARNYLNNKNKKIVSLLSQKKLIQEKYYRF